MMGLFKLLVICGGHGLPPGRGDKRKGVPR